MFFLNILWIFPDQFGCIRLFLILMNVLGVIYDNEQSIHHQIMLQQTVFHFLRVTNYEYQTFNHCHQKRVVQL